MHKTRHKYNIMDDYGAGLYILIVTIKVIDSKSVVKVIKI
jgi:hypothetical protein